MNKSNFDANKFTLIDYIKYCLKWNHPWPYHHNTFLDYQHVKVCKLYFFLVRFFLEYFMEIDEPKKKMLMAEKKLTRKKFSLAKNYRWWRIGMKAMKWTKWLNFINKVKMFSHSSRSIYLFFFILILCL